MKRFFAAVLLVFIGTSVFTQDSGDLRLTFISALNQAEAGDEWSIVNYFANTITANDLNAHLSFLASDEVEGRETGERGQQLAAVYLANQMKKMGLQPGNNGSWYQEYELLKTNLKDISFTLDGKKTYKKGSDFVFFNKNSLVKPIDAEIVFAGYGIEDEKYNNLEGLNLEKKAVFVLAGEPMKDGKYLLTGTDEPSDWSKGFESRTRALSEKGAAIGIYILDNERYGQITSSPWISHAMTGSSLQLAYQVKNGFPIIMVSESMANDLFSGSKTNVADQRKALNDSAAPLSLKLKKERFKMTPVAEQETIKATNVLGMIEGTDKKDEVVIVTAHYDHLGVRDGEVYNGADDDGSGTSAILEIAEAFALAAKNGHRPRRSILIMPVSGEEKGLLGSRYYSDHPVYPLEKTVCDLNIDMIGRIDKEHEGNENYVYIIGSDKLSSELHASNELANEKTSNITLDYTYNAPDDPNRFYYRSDHYNFAKHNIPVIFYFTGVHEDYHKSTDTIDKILFDKMAKITRLVFATAWDVANRDGKLKVDRENDFPVRD